MNVCQGCPFNKIQEIQVELTSFEIEISNLNSKRQKEKGLPQLKEFVYTDGEVVCSLCDEKVSFFFTLITSNFFKNN